MYPKFLPDGRRYVKGHGPLPCDVLFLGESPGDDEDNVGRCFVGRTGQLLDALCERAGWRRGLDMRIDNVLKYKPEQYDKDGPILPHEIERDRPRLLEQFAKCRPKLVFAMGAVAMEAVLGPWLRRQGVEPRLDWMWGLAFDVPRPDDEAVTMRAVATFHPAAGFHDPVMAARFWRSLTGLRTAKVWELDTRPVDYQC